MSEPRIAFMNVKSKGAKGTIFIEGKDKSYIVGSTLDNCLDIPIVSESNKSFTIKILGRPHSKRSGIIKYFNGEWPFNNKGEKMEWLNGIDEQEGEQKKVDAIQAQVDEQLSRVDFILRWADDHEWFDSTFVSSLKERLQKRKPLTERQISALENIEDMVENSDKNVDNDNMGDDDDWESRDRSAPDFGDDIPF